MTLEGRGRGAKTGIEWTDATWNPLRGCSRVSQGCVNCYAETIAARFSGPGQPFEGLAHFAEFPNGTREARWTGKVALASEKVLDAPLHWRKPRRIFVNSVSDLFHENVPDAWIDRIFAVMALCPQHIFQVLTKRPERMRDYMDDEETPRRIYKHFCESPEGPENLNDFDWPLPNVWLGVSVEDQKTADERLPFLLTTPAAKRFISAEPLLGPIDLDCPTLDWSVYPEGYGLDGTRLIYDWVIVGGESGQGARPMHPDWARALRDQCATAGVPFFFKQWGEWVSHSPKAGGDLGGDVRAGRVKIVHPTGQSDEQVSEETGGRSTISGSRYMIRVGKKVSGATLDGREHREFPA